MRLSVVEIATATESGAREGDIRPTARLKTPRVPRLGGGGGLRKSSPPTAQALLIAAAGKSDLPTGFFLWEKLAERHAGMASTRAGLSTLR